MSPFHPGERWMQEVVGVRERVEGIGGAFIRAQMPVQHQEFFKILPWLILGSVDADGQPHASVLVGEPGFVRALDAGHLRLTARPLPGDPLERTLRVGADVGILGLEPGTRRRNRANGTVVGPEWTVRVTQSFGNCPKYIQPRPLRFRDGPVGGETGDGLDALERFASADTFFLASARPRDGGFDVDVSHRGGPPGFVRVEGRTLTFPDFAGNNFFNSLGNLHLHPPVGLLLVDRESGDRLYVTGEGEIVWGESSRAVRIRVRGATLAKGPLPLEWGPT